MKNAHAIDIAQGERFEFGANWASFLDTLDTTRIAQAEQSLRAMLRVNGLHGKRFIDVGSGSGLFSLAAFRLGAEVFSFDYDPRSVACTQEIKRRYASNDNGWHIEEGSVLDEAYLARLGQFDVVYSWGVLHHTGRMREALSNVARLVAPEGQLFIAIYNDQGTVSRYWNWVKYRYVRSRALRWPLLSLHAPYLYGVRWLWRHLSGRARLDRGMRLWHDMVDWVGGYPFEVARPESIFNFFRDRGFNLIGLKTCGGRHGCNEFVFVRRIR
jgi:2-polyprenyl-3-methyl-5-hydroxy-6-metoxy-1,4-benzoquinol methylase